MFKYFFIAGLMLSNIAGAQTTNVPVKLSHYVLDSFSKGRVQLKSGAFSDQSLNYNILTGEMIFDNGGRLLAINDPKEVDTIFIQGRKFIPSGDRDKFYEVLTGTPAPLLLEFTYKIDEPPVSVGIGNASPSTTTTSYSSLISSGGAYAIKLPDDFKVIPGYAYWIRKGDKYLKAGTAKQLISIFPEKKEFINEFIKKNNTSFSKREDVISLVQQIQQ